VISILKGNLTKSNYHLQYLCPLLIAFLFRAHTPLSCLPSQINFCHSRSTLYLWTIQQNCFSKFSMLTIITLVYLQRQRCLRLSSHAWLVLYYWYYFEGISVLYVCPLKNLWRRVIPLKKIVKLLTSSFGRIKCNKNSPLVELCDIVSKLSAISSLAYFNIKPISISSLFQYWA